MAILDEFLGSIKNFLYAKDAAKLQDWLRVEPPLPDQYFQLGNELRNAYRDSNKLEQRIERLIPENNSGRADDGDVWPGFIAFMKEYLDFWRDVNFDDLLETHAQLSALVNACITAFSNPSYGLVILPTAISLSSALAKLAMTLDKRPDLTRKLRQVSDLDQSGESGKTLVEGTAELIQRAFTLCLSERSSNRNGTKDGKPEGKKVGIYSFANLVLKLLFQCRKTRLANQLFTNISQHSPPLYLYPASQRVTYLYYLGRFHFANNHFYRAQLCLQAAYDQCHAQCTSQRRTILIYLIASNMLLGRFPSRALMGRPESADLLPRFAPIGKAIRRGNLVDLKRALGQEGGQEQWFFKKGILLPLLYRCEVLVWRSLFRKVFLLTYQFPADPTSRKAPTFELNDVVTAARYCQRILEGYSIPSDATSLAQGGRTHTNSVFLKKPDLVAPAQGPNQLGTQQGVICANHEPNLLDIEAIVASLAAQGLLHGFISHAQSKFAILGSKQRGGPLLAGFPRPWEVMKARAESDGPDIPGWVKEDRQGRVGGVVNLSGIARPVGSS